MFYMEIYMKHFKKSSPNLQYKPVERIQAILGPMLIKTYLDRLMKITYVLDSVWVSGYYRQ